MDRDAFDFINAHEKLEAAKKFNVALQGEVNKFRSEQKKHTKKIDGLQEDRNKLLKEGFDDKKEMAELVKSHSDEMKDQKDNLRDLVRKMDDLQGDRNSILSERVKEGKEITEILQGNKRNKEIRKKK